MNDEAIGNIRKRGRGRPRVNATPVLVRIPPSETAALDAAIEAHEDEPRPSRPELIRRIVSDWLRERGYLKGQAR